MCIDFSKFISHNFPLFLYCLHYTFFKGLVVSRLHGEWKAAWLWKHVLGTCWLLFSGCDRLHRSLRLSHTHFGLTALDFFLQLLQEQCSISMQPSPDARASIECSGFLGVAIVLARSNYLLDFGPFSTIILQWWVLFNFFVGELSKILIVILCCCLLTLQVCRCLDWICTLCSPYVSCHYGTNQFRWKCGLE